MKLDIIETYPSPIYISGGLLCDISGKNEGTTPDYFCGLFTFNPNVTREEPLNTGNNFYWYHWDGKKWLKTMIAENYALQVGKAAADITGSGSLDIVFAEWDNKDITGGVRPGGNVYWAEQPGEPFNEPWQIHLIASGCNNPHDILAEDLNRDGKPEVLVRNKDGRIVIFKMPKDPRKPWEELVVTEHLKGDGTAFYDITGNGSPDIVTAEGYFENVDGNGKNWCFHSYGMEHLGVDGETRVAVGILHEGHISVVVTESEVSKNARILIYFTSDRGRTWSKKILIDKERNLHALHTLRLYDFDGDGLPDIFTAEMESGKTDGIGSKPRWFLFKNKGNLKFEEKILLDENFGGHLACIGAIKNPGKTDILANDWKANKVNSCGGKNHLIHLYNTDIGI